MKKKSVLISSYHHRELQKLSEAHNLSYYKLVEEMITYFKKTGINPKEPKNENPTKAVKELDKRMVAFLRVQERDILKPLRLEVYNYSKEQGQEVQKLGIGIKKDLDTIKDRDDKRTEAIEAEFNKQRRALLAIAQLLDKKNKSGLISKINTLLTDANQ